MLRLVATIAAGYAVFASLPSRGSADPNARVISNPVLPSHADPSVVRVGADYFLVASSFQYFPGVPVFHSKDLVNWTQIGNVLTRASQLDLSNKQSSEGIWAANIRFHNGTYYVVTTNVTSKGRWRPRNFYVTAKHPRGPWSDPIWLDEGGVDPDFFFDDDGSAYYVRNGAGGIHIAPIDFAQGKLLSPTQHIWGGTGAPYPEGPHIYKRNGLYYLMIAEGGTGMYHRETVARSKRLLWGYQAFEHNPILGHFLHSQHPIKSTGHADLVWAQDGSCWALFLGTRGLHPETATSPLGRETFLAPVTWTYDQWPIIADGGVVGPTIAAPAFAKPQRRPRTLKEEFAAPALAPTWVHLYNPEADAYSLEERRGWLAIKGNTRTLDGPGTVSFVGQRQMHLEFVASTRLDFQPRAQEEAGIAVYLDEQHHYEMSLGLSASRGGPTVRVRQRIGKLVAVVAEAPAPSGPIVLRVSGNAERYAFSVSSQEGGERVLAEGETEYLAAREYTPAYLALYASGHGKPAQSWAYFDWFSVEPLRQLPTGSKPH